MRHPTYILDLDQWFESPDTEKISNKKEVLSYLKSFEPVARSSPYVSDPIAKSTIKLQEMGAFTDGEWCWDSAIVYFFNNYNAKLNADFLRRFIPDGDSLESHTKVSER